MTVPLAHCKCNRGGPQRGDVYFEELSRAKLVDPTGAAFGRKVVWSHPAFANKCVYVRNDKELACFPLAE